jgi:hypothetical protein
MKRSLAGVLLLVVSLAAIYGYAATRRERLYRELLARGEVALAQDNTVAAVEAFSGAITLKRDSMLGYLKRGQTYRRRGELVAVFAMSQPKLFGKWRRQLVAPALAELS